MIKFSFNRRCLQMAAYGAIAATLAACGGGGGAAPDSAQPTYMGSEGSSTPAAATTAATGNSANPVSNSPASATVAPYGQDASQYTLAFADEFENGLDSKVWNDHAWYEASNATKNYTVENGALKIWPQRDASGKFFNRTIDTDGKYTQTYGYFEIEAKLPAGKGTWPAFWVFNHIDNRRPEIDIMEAYAGGLAPWGTTDQNGVARPMMYSATIWQTAGVQAGFQKIATPDLSAGFHKYALKWEPNKQTFYFDGREVYSQNVTMSDPMYIMLDLWFGSASGNPDNSTPTGKSNAYEINYVRAWKFK